MVFRNFRFNIIIRIIVLISAITALAWFIVQSEPIRVVYTGGFIILLVLEFFFYTDRLNKDLNQFFISIFHDDYTSVFNQRSRGRSFRNLYSTLNDITQKFRSLSKEKEMRGQYLLSLIEQVKVGIISFEKNGRVHLVNKAFREMLDARSIRNGSDIKEQEPELFSILEAISGGEKQLLRKKIKGEEKEFSFVSAGFIMEDRFYNLVSVQDIGEELDNRELEAWQKLIRVLTHEIMNSVSPIASLTGSLNDLVRGSSPETGEELLRTKLSTGLTAIQERSAGLIKFTEAYQNLARIPAPVIAEIQTRSLVERIETLFNPQFESSNLRFSIDIQKAPLSFQADLELIEQVIINLVRNSSDAVANTQNPEIALIIKSRQDGKVSIIVRDNGTGIPESQLDRIFVPFFSTKEKGSGIGLSLSRQVILMHKGTINVSSVVNEGSTFEILL